MQAWTLLSWWRKKRENSKESTMMIYDFYDENVTLILEPNMSIHLKCYLQAWTFLFRWRRSERKGFLWRIFYDNNVILILLPSFKGCCVRFYLFEMFFISLYIFQWKSKQIKLVGYFYDTFSMTTIYLTLILLSSFKIC